MKADLHWEKGERNEKGMQCKLKYSSLQLENPATTQRMSKELP